MDFLIIANGEFLIREIILEAAHNKIIIACDGAINKLSKLGITPHVILGDFDSITSKAQKEWQIKACFNDLSTDDEAYFNQQGVKIVPVLDQLHTDLAKAIFYCDQEQASSITIICALGGRMDHHEDALRCLMRAYRKDRPLVLHSDLQTLRFASNETITIHGEVGDKCGVIAFPEGSFSSQGLLYEAKNFPLIFAYSENICNVLSEKTVTIAVTGGALIVMPPQLSSQRSFAEKTEIERLNLQLRDAKWDN